MSAGGPVTVELTRQQKADALRSVKELLLNVGTNWAYTPAPIPLSVLQPTAPEGLSRGLSLRSAALGSWRPSEGAGIDTLAEEARRSKAHAAAAKEDDSWEEEPGSDSGGGDSDDTLSLGDSDEDADGGRGLSYRRPEMGIGASTVSKGKRKRRLRRMVPKRRGEWRVREDDSDYCLDGAADGSTAGAGGGTGGFRWEGPESVDDGEAQRRKEEEQNPGLKVWRERRQQWTGARGEWVPVGESRFKDNPLSKLVNPAAYKDIYARCVLNGNDLPVPVNLKEMTACLVQGWKAGDMWPPRGTAAEPGFAVGGGGGMGSVSGALGMLPPMPKAEHASGKVGGRVKRFLGVR